MTTPLLDGLAGSTALRPAGTAAASKGAGADAAAARQQAQIRQAAQGLEEVLLKQMLEAMTRAQLEKGGFFGTEEGGGSRETTFELLMSQTLAASEPFGLGRQLAGQLAPMVRDASPALDIAANAAMDQVVATRNVSGMFESSSGRPQVPPGGSEKMVGHPRAGRLTGDTERERRDDTAPRRPDLNRAPEDSE